MNIIQRITTIVISTLIINGCGGSEDDFINIVTSCDTNIETLKAQNGISDECKESIQSLLPSAENNIKSSLISLGKDGTNLFLLGADSIGESINLNSSTITIDMTTDGVETRLTNLDYNIKTIADIDATIKPLISISSIIDYSASMSNDDIDDAVSIYQDIYNIFITPIIESEIRLFSEMVMQKLDFNIDKEILNSHITRDDNYQKSSTALYDAMGTGFEELAQRDTPIKLMIVATDGMENASTIYNTEKSLYDLSQQHNIPVILLGSLFSDIDFMKNMAKETNGLFIYSKSFITLKEEAKMMINMVKNIQVIQITKTTSPNSTFIVSVDGREVGF